MSQSIQERVLSKSSTGSDTIEVSRIYISPDRMREDTPAIRRKIDEELAPSILEVGLIHPPVLNFNPEGIVHNGITYHHELVAGWCRLQACIALGLTTIPYNTRDNIDADELLEVELEENLRRSSMTWQENVLGIAKIHFLKSTTSKAKNIKWGQKQTGALLGCSHGHIGSCLLIAKHLKAGDPDIMLASNMSEALRVLTGRKEDAVIESLSKAALPSTAPTAPTARPAMGPARPEEGISLSAAREATMSEPAMVHHVQELEVDLSQMLFNEDNRTWFDKQPDGFVDLLYTDIPYGIDMDNLDYGSVDLERVADEHNVEENLEQMPIFLKNAFRVLKPQRYCIFWYDLVHHEKLLNWGKEAGFAVQTSPLVWCKTHPVKNRAAGKWFAGATEVMMVMAKGTATLRNVQTRNWYCEDGSAERKTQRNPFAKPFSVSKVIIDATTIPGDLVVDPYAGEGSLVRCALNMGRQIKAIEKSSLHFPRLTEHVKKTVSVITRDKATFKS